MNNNKEFVWNENLIAELLEYANTHTRGLVQTINNSYQQTINDFKESKQPKREKLFTTYDGVDIYEGDNWFIIHSRYWSPIEQGKDYGECIERVKDLTFSTIEAADEYIKKHQPKYSEEDMRECFKNARLAYTSSIKEPLTWKINSFEEYIKSLNK